MNSISDTGDGIAVIGMSGRFPGAPNIDVFWRNLTQRVESIAVLTDAELTASGIDVKKLGPNYVRACALLPDVDLFDATFFGYSKREAELMDPQHRVFLETAWETLENAGYDAARYAGAIGVYAGGGGWSGETYYQTNLQGHSELLKTVGIYGVILANNLDYLATRVAYKLNLKGPAMTVQTACSTSLVAVCQACQSLLAYQCDMALAGGVSIDFPQAKGHEAIEGGIFSADGHCRPFDAKGQGTVAGQGIGVVLLKRLADAQNDGDNILAIIRGSGLNNDGAAKVGFTAPSVDGQAEVIALAQAVAGISPDTISYVECHGTATQLGDPIEIAALTKAFRAGTTATGFCAIGSVKSNIGHLNTAAGVAGLIKTILALQHRQLPPSLHFEKLNPKISFADSPFYVNTKLTEWKNGQHPRRAGVSSFGLGGTNAHVVLEEAPATDAAGPSRPLQLLTLSAKTATSLDQATAQLAAHLKAHPDTNLADVAYTLQVGRRTHPHRRIAVARDVADATALLEKPDPKRVFTAAVEQRDAPVIFMFPGQGAQQVKMGLELCRTEPVFRDVFDQCARMLQERSGVDLPAALADPALLRETRFTQPAMFVMEYALAKLWMSWGVQPAGMIGHSIGEYVAACLAGVFSLTDALWLVAERARLMQEQPPGAMLSVRLPEKELWSLLDPPLSIAAINAPGMCVVSGPFAAMEDLERRLKEAGHANVRLHTSHAFHSVMMEPVVAPFQDMLEQVTFHEPALPYVSNVTADWITAAKVTDPSFWAAHVRLPVRFAEGIARLFTDPTTVLLEVGPGQTLTLLARQQPNKPPAQVVLSSLGRGPEQEAMLTALGQLWLAGKTLDSAALFAAEKRRRIPLPTYPFERKRYWIEPAQSQAQMVLAHHSPELVTHTEVIEPPVSAVAPVQPTASPDRPERILGALRGVLQEQSGMNLSDISPTATFTEMGFDSLFLTQASVAFGKRCGVKIRFRQLLEDLSTLRALADYIDQQLPPDAPVAPPVTPVVTVASPSLPADSRLAAIAQQLQSLQQEVATMRKAPSPHSPVAPPPAESKAVGPFKPVPHTDRAVLTAPQQKFLGEFIVRYNLRTKESKRLAQASRARLADPRSVAGFRVAWKEIVYPLACARSAGANLWDVDGNQYVDLTMGFGVNLFGHSPSFVTAALEAQLKLGVEIGPQSPLAGEVAHLVGEMTGHERVTFCNTGSEAVMVALRVARAVTGRDLIVYFSGDYHGVFDEVLGRAGPQGALPIAPGIPRANLGNVVILDYGTPATLEYIRLHGPELAAVLVEPVQSRRPELQPQEFLQELRRLTQDSGTALILDEMITGFRVHPAGIQGLYGIQADLATYGKIIGGGMPIGVLAGKHQFMDALDGGAWQYGDASAPEVGMTFFAGTFVRHPLALAAARAVLQHLKAEGPSLQEQLNAKTSRLVADLQAELDGTLVELVHFGSWFIIRLPEGNPQAGLLLHLLRHRGIHVLEYRPCYVTTAHTDEDFATIVTAFKESVAEMRAAGFFPVPTGNNVVPITSTQADVWVTSQMSEAATCAFNLVYCLTLRGALNVNALRRATQGVVDRHDALRTIFNTDGTAQTILPRQTVDVPLVDLMALPAPAREQQVTDLLDQQARTPFDLGRGPLVRAQLIRLGEQWHMFVLSVHHIVCDGQSLQTILQELGTLYSADCQGTEPPLPPAMQYREFARWQVEQQSSPALAAAEAFWLRQFATPIPALELPTDRPRASVRTFQGAEERTVFDAQLALQLKQLCAKQNCTLFAVLLAGFNILLHRLSGTTDLAIGVPTAGQTLVDSKDLVGHCVNLLPIRLHVRDDRVVSEYLEEAKRTVLNAFDHQNYTFGTLVRRLNLPHDPSRTPLISVLFNVDRINASLNYAGLQAEPTTAAKRFVEFELFVSLAQTDTELLVECDYNSDLFDGTTIQRWLGHYRMILQGIVANPGQRIGELPLLTAAERQQLIVEWNATEKDYRQDVCAHQLVEHQAAKTPTAVAVECANESLTYQELNASANQLARHLRGLGVGAESLVGICLSRNVELVVALLAVLKAGGAYVPLDPAYPPQRTAVILEDAGVQVLLTNTGLIARLPKQSGRVVCLDTLDLSAEEEHNLAPVTQPQHLAYVIFTSGSTGRPKGVAIEHRSTVAFVAWARTVFTPTELARVLFSTSICFDVSVFEWLFPLCCGGAVVVTESALALPAGKGTLFSTVPSVMAELLATGTLPASVQTVCLAGEALPQALVEKLYALPQVKKVYDLYGPTEDTTYSTFALRRPGGRATIGRPIANTQVYLLDALLQPVPVGVAGELHLGGAGLARGYLNRPELTAEKFIPDPFRSEPGARLYKTGDLARYLPDGNIECLGRIDRQVKIRGFRIELGEIEAQLGAHETVGQAVVLAREDAPGDKLLVAYVVSANGVAPVPATLRDWLRVKLPEYMVPSAVVVLPTLPLTPNGKVDRHALPVPEDPAIPPDHEYVAPREALELQLARLWEKIFNRQPIGVRDNFFELGGHSLLAVRLFAQIQKVTGRRLPLATLFQAPTIEQLAEVLKQDGWQAPWQCLVPIKPGGSRPPFYCVHGVGGNILEFLDLAKYLPADQPFYGIQAMGLDGTRSRQTLTVEEMAAHYIKEIQAFQPTGPYYFGGSSFGGMVAYEMAQQFRAAGETVGLLALFDTNGPGYPIHLATANVFQQTMDRLCNRVSLHWENLRDAQGKERLTYLRVKTQKLGRGLVSGSLRRLWRGWLRVRQRAERLWLPEAIRQVQRVGHWAAEDYRPQPYSGDVALFRAMMQPRHIVEDRTLGWGELVRGQLKIFDTPGHHGAIVRDPRAQELARQLQDALRQARDQTTALAERPKHRDTTPDFADTRLARSL